MRPKRIRLPHQLDMFEGKSSRKNVSKRMLRRLAKERRDEARHASDKKKAPDFSGA